MTRTIIIAVFFLLFDSTISSSQIQGLHSQVEGKQQIEVPFEYVNNFIVVNVVMNGILTLKFIFDTGAEYTILNKREIAEVMQLHFEREYKVMGSDLSTELTAYLTRGNHFRMGQMVAENTDLLVLKEDYFRFEEFAGVQVHGIMGANFFKHLILHIDYQRRVLIFQYPEKNLSRGQLKGFQEIPIEVRRNKVYVHSHVKVNPDTLHQLSLLLDTGAGITSLLHTNSHPGLNLPNETIDGNLAMGLGGFLRGYIGRMYRLELGVYHFDNILTQFQQIQQTRDSSLIDGRHGILGNLLLSRFKVIIDYPREKLYLKPIRKYNKSFKFDKSGLGIIATGNQLREIKIIYVIKNSPAYKAGLRSGDIITKVNFLGKTVLRIAKVSKILQGREGKMINMIVRRKGKRVKTSFKLKTLI